MHHRLGTSMQHCMTHIHSNESCAIVLCWMQERPQAIITTSFHSLWVWQRVTRNVFLSSLHRSDSDYVGLLPNGLTSLHHLAFSHLRKSGSCTPDQNSTHAYHSFAQFQYIDTIAVRSTVRDLCLSLQILHSARSQEKSTVQREGISYVAIFHCPSFQSWGSCSNVWFQSEPQRSSNNPSFQDCHAVTVRGDNFAVSRG